MRKVLVAVFGACLLALCLGAQAAHAEGVVTICTTDAVPQHCSEFTKVQDAVDASKAMKNSTKFVITLTNGIYEENIVIGEELAGNNYIIRGNDSKETILQAAAADCEVPSTTDISKRVLKIVGPAVRLENLTIRRGCVRGNSVSLAGAGIWSSGALSLKSVIVISNTLEYYGDDYVSVTGAGIYSSGALDIDSSSFISNQALAKVGRAYGGAVYSIGSAHIVNSTFAYNTAFVRLGSEDDSLGGGIYTERALDAKFNTVVYNQAGLMGGGLVGVGTPSLSGNLFHANTNGGTGPEGQVLCVPGTGWNSSVKCDVYFPPYVNLGPLHWDSRTPIYRPSADSLSIDAATCAGDIRTDQVGDARGAGNGCDLGSVEMGMTYLPSLAVAPPKAELHITGINIKPEGELNSANKVVIEVFIENTGLVAAQKDFWIDLYINPRSDPPNQAGTVWKDLCRSAGCVNDLGITWKFTAKVLPGDVLKLTSRRTNNEFMWLSESNWEEKLAAGDVKMWAYVDSWNGRDKPWGLVDEVDETNNRFGPLSFTVPLGKPQYPYSAAQFPAIESDRPANN